MAIFWLIFYVCFIVQAGTAQPTYAYDEGPDGPDGAVMEPKVDSPDGPEYIREGPDGYVMEPEDLETGPSGPEYLREGPDGSYMEPDFGPPDGPDYVVEGPDGALMEPVTGPGPEYVEGPEGPPGDDYDGPGPAYPDLEAPYDGPEGPEAEWGPGFGGEEEPLEAPEGRAAASSMGWFPLLLNLFDIRNERKAKPSAATTNPKYPELNHLQWSQGGVGSFKERKGGNGVRGFCFWTTLTRYPRPWGSHQLVETNSLQDK